MCGFVFVCYLDVQYIPISNEPVTIGFASVVAIAGVNAYVQTVRRPDTALYDTSVINFFIINCRRYDGYPWLWMQFMWAAPYILWVSELVREGVREGGREGGGREGEWVSEWGREGEWGRGSEGGGGRVRREWGRVREEGRRTGGREGVSEGVRGSEGGEWVRDGEGGGVREGGREYLL